MVHRPSARMGAIANWLAFAATLAVAFALTPYLIHQLGTARYDVWCVAEAVLAYFTLLDLGIAACLVRLTARHAAKNSIAELNGTTSTCLVVYCVAGAIALAIGTPVLLAIAPSLSARAGEDVTPFLLIMLTNVALALPLSVFPTLLEGLERFTAKSVVKLAFLALRTVAIVVAVSMGMGLTALAIVSIVATVLEHTTMALLCRRYVSGFALRLHWVTRAEARAVIGSSMDALLAMLAGRITVQAGAIVVGLMLQTGQVTAFATAARLVEYAKSLLRTVTATLTPGVSARDTKGDAEGIRQLVLVATKWVLYLVLPVNLGLWFFGRVFLVRWVGVDVAHDANWTLAILASVLTVAVAQSVISRVLYGLGQLRYFARLALAEAAINLALTFILVRTYGVSGVAIAVAVANGLFCIAVIIHGLHVVKIDMRVYARAWRKPLAASMVPLLIWVTLGTPAASWDEIALAILVGLIPYGLMVAACEGRVKWQALRLRLPARGRVSTRV